jgi:hypothetical protein
MPIRASDKCMGELHLGGGMLGETTCLTFDLYMELANQIRAHDPRCVCAHVCVSVFAHCGAAGETSCLTFDLYIWPIGFTCTFPGRLTHCSDTEVA